MSKRLLKLAALSTVALAGTAFTYGAMGGWCVITVDELPEYVTVGKPVDITFSVRQHGQQLMPGLRPTLTAKADKADLVVDGKPAEGVGRYTASLIAPRAGNWTITINSGFMNNRTTLAPLPAVAAGSAAPLREVPAARGQRLFVAKGCVT